MTKRVSRRRFGAGVASLGALAAAARFSRARAQAAPLKIGVLLPRSGFLADIGQQCQRGADISVPILKEMGYSPELMNADTESKPEVARTQAEKLIREGANILTGAFESGATAAIAQVCELSWQLRGQATGRQVENATVGVTANQGLFGHGSSVIVAR